MKKYKENYNKTRVSNPAITQRHIHPNTQLVPPFSTLFLLVTSPGKQSPIIFHCLGEETFLWFQGKLIISIPFPLDPVLDDAVPLVFHVLDDVFNGPLVTQRVRLYRSWLRQVSGGEFGMIILMPGGKKGGVDLEVAAGYKGAFECVIVSVRVYG